MSEKDKEVTDSETDVEEKKGLAKINPLAKVTETVAKPQKLVKGDYSVQVHIIEARDLKGRGFGDMSDPVCEVECMQKKQHTKIMKKQLSPVWEEVMVFEYKDVYPEQVEREKVICRVKDANTFRRDVLIGLFEFDLATIYYREHHELYRQWCALTDVTDKHEGIQGYLKLSITVLGPNDEQYIHSAADADDDDGGMMGVMMPPEIEQRGMLLRCKVFSVLDLPMMDEAIAGIGGGCDPYVRIEYAGVNIKTKHFKGQNVEIFQQELQVPVMEPIMSSSIKFSTMDWDAAGTDDRVANMSFDYADIKAKGGIAPRWYHLYGGPEGEQRGHAKEMNRGYLQGSYYRGRLLMEFKVEKSDEPKKDVVTCNGLSPAEKPPEIQWVVQLDLYEGSEIVSGVSDITSGLTSGVGVKRTGKMHIEVHVGRHLVACERLEPKEGRCEWYTPMKDLVFTGPKDPSQVADIFVYLCYKKKRVSFLRVPFKDAVARGWRVPPAWHTLVECKALDALTAEEFPGSLLYSLRAGPIEELPDEPFPESRPLKYDIEITSAPSTLGDEKSPPGEIGTIQTQTTFTRRIDDDKVATVGTLTLTVRKATDLPAMDSKERGQAFATSDPFCKLSIGAQKFKTTYKLKTLNPEWNETFIFKDVAIDAQLNVEVWDHDTLTDDKIGTFVADIRSQQIASKAPLGVDFAVESWFLVSDKYPNAQVMIKFEFKYHELAKSKEVQQKIQAKAVKESKSLINKIMKKTVSGPQGNSVLGYPERKSYQLRCHIYMARNLPAVDSNGLADPYVVVRLCGKKIKLRRKNETLNPQWFETQVMNVTLPFPLALAPLLQCFVFDYDFPDKDDPIGRFSVTCEDILTLNPSIDELKPRWFPLSDFEGKEIPDSKLLATFQLLSTTEVNQLGKTLPDIHPPTTPMFIEIVTMGLRSLQSTLGVHKTFIDFELPNGKRFKTRQSQNPSAKNPNFLQVLKIPVDLPTNAIFSPTLNIEVRDVLLGGLVKRLIGTSSLDMGLFMVEDEKGVWRPAKQKIDIASADDEGTPAATDPAKAALLRQALESAEKTGAEEVESKGEDDVEEKKETKSAVEQKKGKHQGDMKEPLLSGGDVVMDVKDDGEGVGDLGIAGAKDADSNPLAVAEKADKDDSAAFKSGKANDSERYDIDKPDPTLDQPEEVPPYLKGRAVVDDELEDFMPMVPFHSVGVFTGKKSTSKMNLDKFRRVGTFKGLVRLIETKDEPPTFDMKELLTPTELYLRVYILRGLSMTPKDSDGTSDPYLILKIGKQKFSTRDRYCRSTLEPDFYERFEIACTIPGDAKLEITCMDWDGIGDDLIGLTEIDIEDRWFSKDWRKLGLKPVERRTLRTKSSTRSQGKLEMWLEILTPELAKKTPMWDIKPPPPEPFELRVIIWGVRDMPIKDTTTNQNDLYLTGAVSVKGTKKQETDTHWRSKKGKGNFNWRMKFEFNLPIKPWPRLRLQCWDRDIIAANDSICETVISLKGLCKRAMKVKDRVKIYSKNKDRFWLENLRHPNFPGSQGRAEISLELMPKAVSTQLPAGFGRGDPNQNPTLPEPEGRINWSLFHPFDMLKEILGPELYRKACFGCCLMLFIAACVFMAPMIASNVITNILTPG